LATSQNTYDANLCEIVAMILFW